MLLGRPAAGALSPLARLAAAGINRGLLFVAPGMGVAVVAALLALIFAPGDAAPVAYVVGRGPLIGANLLHLKEIEQSAVGVASIGGAGTFGGIVH